MSGVAGYTGLGSIMGVSANQVYMWHQRRFRNGFPAHVAETLTAKTVRRGAPLFDIAEVLAWWVNYEPARGGAPLGNQNRRTHGRYVGRRALRMMDGAV